MKKQQVAMAVTFVVAIAVIAAGQVVCADAAKVYELNNSTEKSESSETVESLNKAAPESTGPKNDVARLRSQRSVSDAQVGVLMVCDVPGSSTTCGADYTCLRNKRYWLSEKLLPTSDIG